MTRAFWRSEDRMKIHLQPYICQAAFSGNGLGCADANSPDTQERSEAKVSRSVLKQRRGR